VVTEDLKFVSDPMLFGRHIVELNATNNALVRSYVWGLDLSGTMDGAGGVGSLLWARMTSGPASGTHFVTYDGNGNVWQLVSASTGTEATRYEYAPIGEPIRVTGPMSKEHPFRFSTRRTCKTTHPVLYEYRACSPGLGRWVSPAPRYEGGGSHLFRFPANDLLDYVDTDGRFTATTCPLCGQWYRKCYTATPHQDPPTLSTGKSCKGLSAVESAIALANRAIQKGECAKWFRDHGSHGEEYPVRCHGKCTLVCLFGGLAWTYPGFGIGLCPANLTGYRSAGIAALLIHELANHCCWIVGGENCANETMGGSESVLLEQ